MRSIKPINSLLIGLLAYVMSIQEGWTQVICPRIVMVQIDGCATPQEKESEYFQFITGTGSVNLSSALSITGFGTRNTWKAVPAIVTALNARVGTCSDGLPIFVNPYAAPYNGVIPPHSMVMAFIDQNAIPPTSNLNFLCGSGLIFVIAGNASQTTPMFANKDECNGNPVCSRTISITIGNCNYSYIYNPFNLDDFNGAAIVIEADGTISYPAANGCRPIEYECDPLMKIVGGQGSACKAFGYELMDFSDPPSPNAAYFTQPNRAGIQYPIGTIIYDSITLYANAWNICKPTNVLEFAFKVNITAGPEIDDSFDRTETTCGYYILPPITGANLTGNQKYWSVRNGTGVSRLPGDTVYTNIDLYVYDKQGATGCYDEKTFSIRFSGAPSIVNPKDTLVPCGANFKLPPFNGTNLSAEVKYYTGTKKSGIAFPHSQFITTGGLFYAYDELGQCFDEDTFNINIVNNLVIPKDTVHNDTFCSEYTLPALKGLNLKYNARSDGLGMPFLAGQKISSSVKLYTFADKSGCAIKDSIELLQRRLQIAPITIDHPCKPILDALPPINGNFLTSRVAYYSEPGGKGKKYLPGDSVHAFKRNFLYDSKILYAYDSIQYSSGKCVSQVQVTIPFFSIVEIDPLQDTTLACGQAFLVPVIKPENFFFGTVYTQSNKQGVRLPLGSPITTPGTYYSYGEFSRCFDEDTFKVNFDPGPVYTNNLDLSGCNEIDLPSIKGSAFRSDSTFYFTQPFGQGIKYTAGNTLNQSQTLYLFDLSQAQCLKQDTLAVNITPQPDIPLPADLNGCDSITLPQDINYPDLRFYSQPGLIASSRIANTWLSSNQTIYGVTGNAGCYDEDTLTISITRSPQIEGVRDTTLCNELLLPVIKGNFLTGDQHYHIIPNDQGQDFYGGVNYATESGIYYAWNRNGNCYDEDTLQITILPKPAIDSLDPVTACEQFILPQPGGVNLNSVSYFTGPGGSGIEYPVGSAIRQSTTLYAFQDMQTCPAQRPLKIEVRDSTTSQFLLPATDICKGDTLRLQHRGKGASPSYAWTITKNAGLPVHSSNLSNVSVALDSGQYQIQLIATSGFCDGAPVNQSIQIVERLTPLTNLICLPEADRIVFNWDQVPGARDYKVELITGPTGVRSPYQMIFGNLNLGDQVGIRVTPLGTIDCANGQAAALTCATRICDNVTIAIQDEAPFCSGDGPIEPIVITRGISDTTGYRSMWSGPGIIDGVFYPALAGPGNHIIQYTLTKDSCRFSDTAIYRVGSGSVLILNDKAVECAPPSQQQFNIRMRIQTDNLPYLVYYSYSGNNSSVFPSSAENFTLSALFGLIGDSVRIDSVVDAAGCKMQITSNAGTQTFRAVRFITARDTTSVCDFTARTYQYRIRIRNTNANDPLFILSGNGQLVDSFYVSPNIPFGQRHQASISHSNACDTLAWDLLIPCSCDSYLDTLRFTACQNDTVTIRNKIYTINNRSGSDTIPSSTAGFCDTIRFIDVRFLNSPELNLRPTICPGDTFMAGGMIFDQLRPSGSIRLEGQASNGCDSIITVTLDFYAPVVRTVRDTICSGDTLVLSGLSFHANHSRDSIRFINQSVNGCDSLVYFIIQVENIMVNAILQSSGCSVVNSKSVLIQSISGGSAPYTYQIANGNPSPIGNLPLRLSQFTSDTFNLTIRSTQGCASVVPVRFAPFNGNLRVDLGEDTTVVIGAQVPLNISSNFALRSIRWITQNSLSCLDCINPIASPLTSTLYIVEAADVNGCTARDTLWIFINPEVLIYVPNILNVFSVDERNREMQIYPSEQVQNISRFTLFDRWGTTVVDLSNLGAGGQAIPVWDGRFKGIDAPNSVYVYKIVYTTFDGRSKIKYGDITVHR